MQNSSAFGVEVNPEEYTCSNFKHL